MKRPPSVLLVICLAPLVFCAASFGETPAAAAQEPRFHPAVTAFFESADPFVQEVVLPNIEANRKADAVLEVVDADGNPLAGAAVSAALKRHEFFFGHCDLATERDPENRALLNGLFHFTCPGNVTKWRAYAKGPEKYDFSKIDAALDFCGERDITFEWHFLSGYHPEWLETVTPESEKARYQIENSKTVLRRYRDKVKFFQVINEDWLTQVGRAKVYTNQTAWFSELSEEFPEVELGVCDCWSFNLKGRLPSVAELEKRYPGIDFISMHAHKPRQLWASPKEMYETYDPYLDSDIKIHLTEFGIILGEITGGYRSDSWDEDKLAEYFVQALATAFSHQSVRVFNLWSNYDKFTGNRLWNEDGEPNEKYRAIKCLLQDKLSTRASGTTDQAGRFAFRGFHGSYDLTLKFPSGKESSVRAEIGGKTTGLKLVVDRKAETLEVVATDGAE